ncbi:peptide-methionine (S)-S-oxide reductase [Tenacibaculum sp. MAR_2009_124]|uniref:peptide-methionine (S)-S-oxide reductase MsrA n=1 Tax=Tenacibaculum sp. MAR_2009_124 TaxID=1250059 RepID=UPI000898BA3C|nr:peptide-methionine (S)-S-oxide reductase MsrA [Tenacibaculum sp. MAR_2009_124]SEC94577.1 peptide-methionine (S)-S-oxide reductase [Tenacibaculum sp. MAR_2009_124]
MKAKGAQLATFGGGCFWCIEVIFQQLKGVLKVTSGYSGGNVPGTPTYREVSSGKTGHAEVIQILFDTDTITYEELLLIFMTHHDATTENTVDIEYGSQYRSVIFYHTSEQQEIAEKILAQLKPNFDKEITTEVVEFSLFFEAEEYHQDYYVNNKEAPYCKAIITPKLEMFRKLYKEKVKQ